MQSHRYLWVPMSLSYSGPYQEYNSSVPVLNVQKSEFLSIIQMSLFILSKELGANSDIRIPRNS